MDSVGAHACSKLWQAELEYQHFFLFAFWLCFDCSENNDPVCAIAWAKRKKKKRMKRNKKKEQEEQKEEDAEEEEEEKNANNRIVHICTEQ